MNSVVLSGYVATDIELKSTQNGIPVTSFKLAVKRPKTKNDITDFFTLVCWRHTAEFVAKHLSKGSGIEVKGILTTRSWEDKDGAKRTTVEVVVDEVEFGKSNKAKAESQSSAPTFTPGPATDFEEIVVEDDDLPF